MNREDLKSLASLRIEEAKCLNTATLYCGAYYLAGYAVECALKACIAKQIKEHDFPDKKLINDSYTHDLEKLIAVSGLKEELAKAMAANHVLEVNWTVVKDWSEDARYRLAISAREAQDLIDACIADTNGILSLLANWWLRRRLIKK